MSSSNGPEGSGGYRPTPAGGPRLRSDIIEVYVFRTGADDATIELLLLERATEPLGGTWQPVMGHIESGEHAVRTALREMHEEIGLAHTDPALIGLWALEQVHPYYVAQIDSIVLSPRFAVQVERSWEPTLNAEHSAHRWLAIDLDEPGPALREVMWPGQKRAIEELVAELARPGSRARSAMAIRPGDYL